MCVIIGVFFTSESNYLDPISNESICSISIESAGRLFFKHSLLLFAFISGGNLLFQRSCLVFQLALLIKTEI